MPVESQFLIFLPSDPNKRGIGLGAILSETVYVAIRLLWLKGYELTNLYFATYRNHYHIYNQQ